MAFARKRNRVFSFRNLTFSIELLLAAIPKVSHYQKPSGMTAQLGHERKVRVSDTIHSISRHSQLIPGKSTIKSLKVSA